MDESLQQLIALGLVFCVVALEWARRRRARNKPGGSCEGCDNASGTTKRHADRATPLKFYPRKPG